MRVLSVDPGETASAWVELDTSVDLLGPGSPAVVGHGSLPNDELLGMVRAEAARPDAMVVASHGGVLTLRAEQRRWDALVIEEVRSYGMPVGREVFDTVWWCGRLEEAALPLPLHRLGRLDVRSALCHDARAGDPNVRAAIIDRYGGKARAIGTVKAPGPLHGVVRDAWSALGLGLTWADQDAGRWSPPEKKKGAAGEQPKEAP